MAYSYDRRVAHAKTLVDLVADIKSDADLVARRRKEFSRAWKQRLDRARHEGTEAARTGPYPVEGTEAVGKGYDATMAALSAALKDFSATTDATLNRAVRTVSDLTDPWWDPELEAEDNAPTNPVAPYIRVLYEALSDVENLHKEVSERYMPGRFASVLASFLPPTAQREAKDVVMDFMKEWFDRGNMVDSLNILAARVQALANKYPAAASAGLPILEVARFLVAKAMQAKDEWTLGFAKSIEQQAMRGRALSSRQLAVFLDKVRRYGLPEVDTSKLR